MDTAARARSGQSQETEFEPESCAEVAGSQVLQSSPALSMHACEQAAGLAGVEPGVQLARQCALWAT